MLDMLTADAVVKHGHDPEQCPTPNANNASFLSQMPLSLFGSVLRKQTFSLAPVDATIEAAQSSSSHDKTTTTTATTTHHRLMTEPNTPAGSPAISRQTSTSSCHSIEGKPRKRNPRPKTTFNLAQPPPFTGPRHKLHLRPKVLLQLHQVIPGRRPKPVYEVIPFSLLAPRSTRRLARTFNSRDRLGPSDLLIVKAEAYDITDEERTDDERWGSREVVGIICPAKKSDKDPSDRTTLLLEDGSSWEVTNMPNGGYEFSWVDDHGLTLKRRWIPKPALLRRVSAMSVSNASPVLGSPGLGPDDKKFNFSTISANSRRHPIIASMSRISIDVLESYTMPSVTSPPTPGGISLPLNTPLSLIDGNSFLETNIDRLPVKTDDALRTFIALSGVWVAFSENWSPAYSFSKQVCHPYQLTTTMTSRSTPNRAVSMSFIDSPRSVSPASTIDEKRRSIPKLFRSGTQKLQSSTSFSNSPISTPTNTTVKTSPASSPIKTRSRRANSTGTADLLTRSNGSTRKRFGFALEDRLPETEEERQSKRSMELLRIKEMVLPETPPSDSPATAIPPVKIVEPNLEKEYLSPPGSPNQRTRKTQSAYNPVTTAGLWDSGVVDGPGLRTRPTSLVVVAEKKQKARRKQERVKSKDKDKDKDPSRDFAKEEKGEKEGTGKQRGSRFKQRFLGLFRSSRDK